MTGERAKESVKEIESGRERDSLGIEGDGEKSTLLFFGKERQTNWQTDHRQATALTTATQTLTLTLTRLTRTHIAGRDTRYQCELMTIVSTIYLVHSLVQLACLSPMALAVYLDLVDGSNDWVGFRPINNIIH